MVSLKRTYFVVILALLSATLSAGRLDKAFEALDVHDYFKAKDLFEKSIKSDPMLANYGLSIIYSRSNNPFYQLDSAFSRIEKSEQAYGDTKAKDRKKIFEEQGIDLDTIRAQKQNIASLALDEAIKQNTVPALNYVVGKYKFSNRYAESVRRRDELAFSLAQAENTWGAYKAFADTYPEAVQAKLANDMYEKLLFEETTKGDTPEQYMVFIKAYPSSPYVRKAQDRIFELTTPDKSLEQFTAFVRLYPDSPYAAKAWDSIYKLWFSDFSDAEVMSFRSAFPRSPLGARLEADIKTKGLKYFPILSKDKMYGFVNSKGEITVNPQYDFVDDFSSRAALVGRGDKVAYIDPKGDLLTDFVWDDGRPFEGELAVVSCGDYDGVINKAGGVVLDCVFDDVTLSSAGPILARKDGKYRYYSRVGRMLFDEFDSATPFTGDMAVVKSAGRARLINSRGMDILSGNFSDIMIAGDSTLFIMDSLSKWTVTDLSGTPRSTKKYDAVGRFSDGLAPVETGSKYGYINPAGKEVIAVNMTSFGDMSALGFKNKRAKTSYRGKYGMISTAGKRLLPNLFDDIITADTWPVPVQKSGLWGYANDKVSIVIKCVYDSAEPFKNGRAIVVRKGLWGVINTKGVILIPLEYSNIEPLGDDMYIVAKNGKTGIVNQEGAIILPIEYDRLREYSPGVLQVVMDGEFLYFDINTGKFIYKGLD